MGRLLEVMAIELSLHRPRSPHPASEGGGRVCSLDFRPNRFFGCKVEKVFAEFFTCNELALSSMPDAFWDLTQGIIRPGLDDRVLVEAQFSPGLGRGDVTMTLFYRLPCTDSGLVDKVLHLLDRRSTSSGYHRFGTAEGGASLRGRARVRTSIVGEDEGESLLMTTILLSVCAVSQPCKLESSEGGQAFSKAVDLPATPPPAPRIQPKP